MLDIAIESSLCSEYHAPSFVSTNTVYYIIIQIICIALSCIQNYIYIYIVEPMCIYSEYWTLPIKRTLHNPFSFISYRCNTLLPSKKWATLLSRQNYWSPMCLLFRSSTAYIITLSYMYI